ncbi:MAG TPA: cytochrome c biogenesis protein CcsA [Gemmatimonadales bacterium]|nr:cytochrome c biogenesis protein CcsA [Gemmatimonadales bacterium]
MPPHTESLDYASAATANITRGRWILAFGILMLAGLYILALEFTPPDRLQGPAQKILYIHPPAAYAMQLAFTLVGICSGLYLWLADPRLDVFAEASAEVGMWLGLIVIITGPIWGRPVWGTYWAWDARLTFTLIELLVFAGYFALRSAVRDRVERTKFAAVVGLTALVLVPFNHLTVYLFASQHPEPVFGKPEAPSAPWVMTRTFITGFFTFTVIYLGFVTQRYGIGLRALDRELTDAG